MLSGRQDALSYVRIIVNAGWSIYPRGYFYGYLLGAVDETLLVVVYNVDDFVNKIAFVLACWSAATAESEEKWRCGQESVGHPAGAVLSRTMWTF